MYNSVNLVNAVNQTVDIINTILKEKESVLIAIDGHCGGGKSTFAEALSRKLPCNVFHMDDFFLRPEQRTEKRLDAPGGNVDFERFLSEVLIPLAKGECFSYCPYDCHAQDFKAPVEVSPQRINIVEGAYSCRPEMWDYYDVHIFIDITYEKQKERILLRNGNNYDAFVSKWIPLEEKYFSFYNIKEKCEIHFEF